MKSIKLYLTNNSIVVILVLFLAWRLSIYIFAKLTLDLTPLQSNFLGGGMRNYMTSPLLWGYANFDGEHYLAISRVGYQPLTHFFFPAYPLLISLLAKFIGGNFVSYLYSSLLISNILFLGSLLGLFKLLSIDFNKKISTYTIILLLAFPLSFYFAASYNESLFLFLVVWCFYASRRKWWILAGLLAMVASATRVIGFVMFIVLLIEIFMDYRSNKKISVSQVISLFIAPLGLVFYMYFMFKDTGDALVFLNNVSIYGEQRGAHFVGLLQIFFRYIFRIIPSLGLSYIPAVYISWLELFIGVWLLIASAASFIKLRMSYCIYLVMGFLIPSFSGSFSSLPRYAIVLFPAFIITALYLIKLPKYIQITIILLTVLLLGITQTMFLRGYWVS